MLLRVQQALTVDGVELKLMTAAQHEQLHQLGDLGDGFILRMPILPGVNDNTAHFETAAALVRDAKSLVRIDVLPYQRAAGAKYEMVSLDYKPGFDDSRTPEFFTQIFDREGIPFQLFR